HLRADLPAAAAAFPDRPAAVRHAGVRQPAGRVPLAAGGHVGLLPEGRLALPRDTQPGLRGHDALHADRHPVHGDHVPVAGDDLVAPGVALPLAGDSLDPRPGTFDLPRAISAHPSAPFFPVAPTLASRPGRPAMTFPRGRSIGEMDRRTFFATRNLSSRR